MSTSFDRIAKSAASVFLMLLGCVFVLMRIARVSEWETNYATRPSVSSEEAVLSGTLARRLPVAKRYLRLAQNDSVRIADAWIEQRSALRYRYFLWWPVRTKMSGSVLLFAPDSGSPVVWPEDIGIAMADSTVRQRRVRDRAQDAFFIDIIEPYPDSLRFVECWQQPFGADSVIPVAYRWLPRCPPAKAGE